MPALVHVKVIGNDNNDRVDTYAVVTGSDSKASEIYSSVREVRTGFHITAGNRRNCEIDGIKLHDNQEGTDTQPPNAVVKIIAFLLMMVY